MGGRAEPEVPGAQGVPEDEGFFGGVPARLCSPLLDPAGQPRAIQPRLPLVKVLCQGAVTAKGGQLWKGMMRWLGLRVISLSSLLVRCNSSCCAAWDVD